MSLGRYKAAQIAFIQHVILEFDFAMTATWWK